MLGFVGGLALDLAPPADHVAGRWALALVRGRLPRRPGAPRRRHAPRSPRCVTVAACSFVGTSIFALSGMLLRDPAIPVGEALSSIPLSAKIEVPTNEQAATVSTAATPRCRRPGGPGPAR